MLGSDFGGLRPWEVDEFRPGEFRALTRYKMELDRKRRELG